MGLINQVLRSLKRSLKNLFKRNKKKKVKLEEEPDVVPGTWAKKDEPGTAKTKSIIIKHKRRVPGLRTIKRLIAGFLLLINFVLSQFLLGATGDGAQGMFIIFLLNSFILADYLWKTRSKSE